MSAPPHQFVVCESVVLSAVQRMCKSLNILDTAWPLPGSGGALIVKASASAEGRTVHAARAIRRAEQILEAHAYTQVIGSTHCRTCMSNDIRKEFRCETCGQQFCSEGCAKAWQSIHTASKECEVMRHLRPLFHSKVHRKGQAKRNPEYFTCTATRHALLEIDQEDGMDFCLLCLTLARAFAERFVMHDNTASAVHVHCGLPDNAFEEGKPPSNLEVNPSAPNLIATMSDEVAISFADVASLTTNASAFSGKMLRKAKKQYELYRGLAVELPQLFPLVTQQTFLNLHMANQCNTYGFWAPISDYNLGQGLFPLGSYINHTCAPNVFHPGIAKGGVMQFFALRDINEGEEISISYTDPRMPELCRREALEASQLFTCRCTRCVAERQHKRSPFDAETALCRRCASRGYMVPRRLLVEFFGHTNSSPSAAASLDDIVCFDCGIPVDKNEYIDVPVLPVSKSAAK